MQAYRVLYIPVLFFSSSFLKNVTENVITLTLIYDDTACHHILASSTS